MTKKTEAQRLPFLAKIADIRSRVSLKFDAENDGFKRHGKGAPYVTLSGVMRALNPLLEEHGLLLTQAPDVSAGRFCIVTVIQEVEPDIDECGNLVNPCNHISATWPIGDKANEHKQAGATTYAARYSLVRLLGLVAEDDDDGNFASGVGGLLDKIKD